MKGKVILINKYKNHPEVDKAYFIGRGSGLGNPYTHIPSAFTGTIKVGSREEACEKYHDMFQKCIVNSNKPPAKTMRLLNQMLKDLHNGKTIGLVCFCSPKLCHGETIKEYLESHSTS